MSVPGYRWHFGVRQGSANYGDNPVHHLFTDQFRSLVREVIQNSLDVPNGKGPVTVKFSFDKIDASLLDNFFELGKYIEGGKVIYSDPSTKAYKKLDQMGAELRACQDAGEISFLKISDTNTLGMDYQRDVLKKRLCAFAYNLGGGSKPNLGAGGSFGYGKATYFNASPFRTVLVSTLDENNNSNFVGVSWLSTSNIEDKKYEQAGYYTLPTESDMHNEDPVSDVDKIPEVFRRNEQGSSFFIMGAKPSPSVISDIYEAAIFNFWYPILRNELIVEVEGKDTLKQSTIREAMLKIPAFSDSKDAKKGHNNPFPYLESVCNKGKEAQGFYYWSTESERLGLMHLYVVKKRDVRDRILFMRRTGMLISYRTYGYLGFYGVFVCEGEKGNILLQKAENPEHKHWDSKYCEYEADKPDVDAALAEIEDFINGKLKEIFAFNDANKLGINGLEQYAYVQSAYEETQDDQMSDDDGTGDFSGESSENGFTNTTELVSDKAKINRPKNESKGVELVEKITTVEPSNEGEIEGQYDPELEEEDDEEQGEEEQEEDNNQKEENEEQENEEEQEEENDDEDQEEEEKLPDSGEAEGGKNKTDKDGTSGTFMVPLKMKNMALRTFQEDGLWNHRILIQSSRNVENCTLKIFIGGEDSDEELEITYSNIGTVEGNSVKDVSLKADSTNVIIVRFEDNMKHSLIVNAYENK